ncbi:MAG: hypothetical protein WD294_15595 [Phycisphaeraceae bacterium]
MANGDGVQFTRRSAKKVADVVRHVHNTPARAIPRRSKVRSAERPIMFFKITDETDGEYSLKLQRYNVTSNAFEDDDRDITHDTAAVAFNGETGVPTDSIVPTWIVGRDGDSKTRLAFVPPAKTAIAPNKSQRFTSDGSFTPPSNATVCYCLAIGGGGGGGSGGNATTNTIAGSSDSLYIGGAGGGGGAPGGATLITFDPARVDSIDVAIGQGGDGRVSGGATGTNGGTTELLFDHGDSITTTIQVAGGSKGGSALTSTGSTVRPGRGGSGSTVGGATALSSTRLVSGEYSIFALAYGNNYGRDGQQGSVGTNSDAEAGFGGLGSLPIAQFGSSGLGGSGGDGSTDVSTASNGASGSNGVAIFYWAE